MRILVRLTALLVLALLIGFAAFVVTLPASLPISAMPRADAIVVLTGGGGSRINAAAQLLAQGHGQRLLISGVNGTVRPSDIQRLFHLDAAAMACCIDLDYRARNTLGNADEIAAWARAHQYRQLIVVTSAYHMPRALIELRAAMPAARLIPFAVAPAHLGWESWRRQFVEYLKYIAILARDRLGLSSAPGHRS